MPAQENLADHIAAAKRHLVHLAGLSQRSVQVERRILDAALERLKTVQAELMGLRPSVMTESLAADRYQALTLEAGQLATVIASAQRTLNKG